MTLRRLSFLHFYSSLSLFSYCYPVSCASFSLHYPELIAELKPLTLTGSGGAVIQAESNFRPDAISRKAIGLMQIMPRNRSLARGAEGTNHHQRRSL